MSAGSLARALQAPAAPAVVEALASSEADRLARLLQLVDDAAAALPISDPAAEDAAAAVAALAEAGVGTEGLAGVLLPFASI
jgi:hypothetical protein